MHTEWKKTAHMKPLYMIFDNSPKQEDHLFTRNPSPHPSPLRDEPFNKVFSFRNIPAYVKLELWLSLTLKKMYLLRLISPKWYKPLSTFYRIDISLLFVIFGPSERTIFIFYFFLFLIWYPSISVVSHPHCWF